MNQETFGWREAANHWSQGIDIQWSYIGEHSWKDFTDRKVTFYREGIVYRLRPEPVEPVKWARGAYWIESVRHWVVSEVAFNSIVKFRSFHGLANGSYDIFPAKFDSEGFLIVPPEFQHLK